MTIKQQLKPNCIWFILWKGYLMFTYGRRHWKHCGEIEKTCLSPKNPILPPFFSFCTHFCQHGTILCTPFVWSKERITPPPIENLSIIVMVMTWENGRCFTSTVADLMALEWYLQNDAKEQPFSVCFRCQTWEPTNSTPNNGKKIPA
jgi:hypothetical protein